MLSGFGVIARVRKIEWLRSHVSFLFQIIASFPLRHKNSPPSICLWRVFLPTFGEGIDWSIDQVMLNSNRCRLGAICCPKLRDDVANVILDG
jgi:hypothetical protein